MALLRPYRRALLTCFVCFGLCCLQPLAARGADDTAEPSPSELPPSEPSPSDLSYSGSLSGIYGLLPGASDSLNPYGAGIGLRLGITLPVRLYLGLSYEHFFGGEPVRLANIVAWESEATVDEAQAWLGYQLPLDGITLRACLGLGVAYLQEETLVYGMQTASPEPERSTESALGFVWSPALQLAFPVGAASLLVEGRYSIVPEEVAEADALFLGVGFGADI